MALVNEHFLKLPDSYLFSDIAKKINTFKVTHPKDKVISLGIGDVTRPLPKAVIEAMHKAVDEMAVRDTFRGYGPESILNQGRYLLMTEQKAILETLEIFCGMIIVSE